MAFPDFLQQSALDALTTSRRRWSELGYASVFYQTPPPTPSTGSIYDVRVEANYISSATLRWTYNGTSDVKVYRSTDNVSYTLVDTIVSTSPVIEYEYIDDGTLLEHTLYYYRLTDNNGLTYTAPVYVVSYLITMPTGTAATSTINLNPVVGEVTAEDFNTLVDAVNAETQSSADLESVPCDVCSSNGSLVINCQDGCTWFRTVLDQDTFINSISLIGCDGCPPIDFVLPPNTIRGICGWPVGCNYGADECFTAPISAGPNGRVCKTNGLCYDGYWNAAAGGGATPQTSGCACPQFSTTLAMVCCDDCTLECNP